MNYRTAISLCLAAFLAACSKSHGGADPDDPNVQLVKGQASEAQGLTIGQVLDAKSNCVTKRWTTSKDKYQRDLVSFECHLAPLDDAIKHVTAAQAKEISSRLGLVALQCRADPSPFIASQQQSISPYYAPYANLTETLEWVVNQGQVVEIHVGVTDRNNEMVPMSQSALQFVPGLMEKPDGAQAEESMLVGFITPPRMPMLSCGEMLGATQAQTPSPSASTASADAAASGITYSPGDAEPPPENR